MGDQQPIPHSLNSPFDLHSFMSTLEQSLYALDWNNNTAVVIITLITYEYLLQLEKEVTFVWKRRWSVMTYLYLVVRYFGIVLAMVCAVWGGLIYLPEAVMVCFCSCNGVFLYIFAWRKLFSSGVFTSYTTNPSSYFMFYWGFLLPVVALYVVMDAFLWSRPSALSVQEVMLTPNVTMCTTIHHIGPMPAIYFSIPIICYDILLVVLAIAVLGKHLKERKEARLKPNTYLVMIVRYHVIYFVLNLASQAIMAILWAHTPIVVLKLVLLYKDTAPLIIVPRFIISIWDTHANDKFVHNSVAFEECVCWTSPPQLEQSEIDGSELRKEVYTCP
ncbi:hypothetical protein DFJ58DRAFT_742948 [Suillus subalutaceus]|uniref:uncharacterized protein n=1 Tax=Suillus subalutaceus TaxID=48586 RepID=UPI001B872FC8|nr:uncharacterized protein DFJ58DRAFT_742948 [Suillus subalutaceus]KAG1867244.1 hypothetical protein DFJ58DRAFT_742948 [Suillus subalutaceus]